MQPFTFKFNTPYTDFKNLIFLLHKHDVYTGLGMVVDEEC